jgi:hypothetical protein
MNTRSGRRSLFSHPKKCVRPSVVTEGCGAAGREKTTTICYSINPDDECAASTAGAACRSAAGFIQSPEPTTEQVNNIYAVRSAQQRRALPYTYTYM